MSIWWRHHGASSMGTSIALVSIRPSIRPWGFRKLYGELAIYTTMARQWGLCVCGILCEFEVCPMFCLNHWCVARLLGCVISRPLSWQNSAKTLSMMTSSNGNIFRVTRLCAGIHRSPVNSPHKGEWRGTLMFSLICVWKNGWVNNRKAGDLRHYRAHYDVTVMHHCARRCRSTLMC